MTRLPGAIPVRSYLKKYVLYTENLQPDEPLPLDRRGTIPRTLGALLQGKMNLDYTRDGYNPQTSQYPDLLAFTTDWWRSNQLKIILTMEAVRFFDAFLYDDFHDFLLRRIMYSREGGGKEKEVIEQVMHELDIVDDISFDALKKSSFRLRNIRNIPHFRFQNCTNS